MTRDSTEIDRNGLMTATKQLLADLGGVAAAETCTRVAASKLHEYGALNYPERFMPIDVVLDLERVCGTPIITAALARLTGHVLVPIDLPGEGDVAESLQRVAGDAGRTMGDAVRALNQGMPASDMAQLHADLTELHAHTAAALAILTQRMRPAPSVVVLQPGEPTPPRRS